LGAVQDASARIISVREWNASGEWFDGSERGECGERNYSRIAVSMIDRRKLQQITNERRKAVHREHPRSAELYARAKGSLLSGVPMNWMKKWAGAFPVFVARAKGAHFTDVDGREYVDLCLGDTGAMTGHSPEIVAEAIAKRVREGITLMLPTEDSLWVGERVETAIWIAVLAVCVDSDGCEPVAIRIAREITQRSKVLVFNYCYHGTVDESFATIHGGVVGPRRGNIGPPVNPRRRRG